MPGSSEKPRRIGPGAKHQRLFPTGRVLLSGPVGRERRLDHLVVMLRKIAAGTGARGISVNAVVLAPAAAEVARFLGTASAGLLHPRISPKMREAGGLVPNLPET